jgi:hypothetical protein
MPIDRTRSEDFDEESPGGWDAVGDEEAAERDAEDSEVEMLVTDAAMRPDDPVAGEAARRGADPDLAVDDDRGEEP